MVICYECFMLTSVVALHRLLIVPMANVAYEFYFAVLVSFSISIIYGRYMLSINLDGRLLVLMSTAC